MKVRQQSEINVGKVTVNVWAHVKFASIVLAATIVSLAISTQASAQSMSKADYSAAKSDDAQTKLDADYKVATQNCASLADEAKSSCVADAKVTFGK